MTDGIIGKAGRLRSTEDKINRLIIRKTLNESGVVRGPGVRQMINDRPSDLCCVRVLSSAFHQRRWHFLAYTLPPVD